MISKFSSLYKSVRSRFKTLSESTFSDNSEVKQQLLLDPPPVWSRTLIWTLGVGSFSLLAWSTFHTVEETAQLPGQLETIRSEVTVKSPASAYLSTVDVRQHQLVDSGQLLFALDREDILPSITTLRKKFDLLLDRNHFQESSFLSRKNQLESQIELNQTILDRLKPLFDDGVTSEVQYLEKQNDVFQARQQYQSLLDERQKQLALEDIEKNDLLRQINDLEQRSFRYDILSPISGSLQALKIQSKGEWVREGDLLATIVPQEDLVANVYVSSRLSAPVTPGTEAEITVDAFPATDYGSIIGKVVSISPTTSNSDQQVSSPAYIARIGIQRDALPENLPPDSLRSGMGINARVVLEKKRAISIVFGFVQDIFSPITERH